MSTSRNPFIQKTVKLLASSITDEFKIPVKYTQAKRIFDSLNVEVTRTRGAEQDQPTNDVEAATNIDEIVELNKSFFSFSAPALEDRYSSLIPLGVFEDGKQFVWDTRAHNALLIEAASTSTDHMLLEKTITQHCEILNERWDLNRISDTVIYDKNATTAHEVDDFLKQVEKYLNSLLDHAPKGGKQTLNVIDDRFVSFEKISRKSHPHHEQMNKNNELLKKVMRTVSDRKKSMVTLFVATNTTVAVNPLDEWVKVNTGISFNGSEGFALDNYERVFRIYPSLSKEYVNNLSETSGERVGKPYFGVIQKPDVVSPKQKVSNLTEFSVSDFEVDSKDVVNLKDGFKMLIKGSDIDGKRFAARKVIQRVLKDYPKAKVIVVGSAAFSQGFEWYDDATSDKELRITMNVVTPDDSEKIKRLKSDLSKESLTHPMIVVFNTSSNLDKWNGDGVWEVLSLRKMFMEKKQPKGMATMFIEDPEAGADQWLPMIEEKTEIKVLPNKLMRNNGESLMKKNKALVIGPSDLSDALQKIYKDWEFESSISKLDTFWEKLRDGEIPSGITSVFIVDVLFAQHKEKEIFSKIVAYSAPHCFVGVLSYKTELEKEIKDRSKKELKNSGKSELTPFYFIDRDSTEVSINAAIAEYEKYIDEVNEI